MKTLSPRAEIKGEEQTRTSELPMKLPIMIAVITLACLLLKKVKMVQIIHLPTSTNSNTAEVEVAIDLKQLQQKSLHLGRSL